MNFTYVINTPKDGMSGYRAEGGRWTGMTGNLKRGEIDIGMVIISLQDESYVCKNVIKFL